MLVIQITGTTEQNRIWMRFARKRRVTWMPTKSHMPFLSYWPDIGFLSYVVHQESYHSMTNLMPVIMYMQYISFDHKYSRYIVSLHTQRKREKTCYVCLLMVEWQNGVLLALKENTRIYSTGGVGSLAEDFGLLLKILCSHDLSESSVCGSNMHLKGGLTPQEYTNQQKEISRIYIVSW